ncbi:unnamed protein product [Cuscuta campestris]|uniref:Chitin-binding type-1 domain-containing protein n=1 Tax=Cuscuta campestris TaxID=132261 RepID=A0A484MHB7_9ASTE|nr:unnamed protein product [Cuscuta campestris]
MELWKVFSFSVAVLILAATSQAQPQCGSQAGGASCAAGYCCSQYGYCGTTAEYCSPSSGCQSQCSPSGGAPPATPGAGGDISGVIREAVFDEMLKYRDDPRCHAPGFYTYDAFIAAAKSFGEFGTTGDSDTVKREIAAFLGQTSHETTGGWDSAPDGRYAWGYCFLRENTSDRYCNVTREWSCAPGQSYFGRGPIQISYNYNYGAAGKALGYDLISNPDLVATDPTLSFKTALWFWMTPQGSKPSSHDVMTGQWTPSAAGRVPGYGLVTNIINGGVECGGGGAGDRVADRIGFYKRYCDIFGVAYGDNLDCSNQTLHNTLSNFSTPHPWK